MHLTPRELDKLVLHQAGFLAQKRLARGIRLNYPEAVALIATQLLEFIRDGRSVAELMDLGRQLLGREDVADGVADMIDEVQVEGTFPDGTKLVTVHHPVASARGNLSLALYGSFLPVPAGPELGRSGVRAGSDPGQSGVRPLRRFCDGVAPAEWGLTPFECADPAKVREILHRGWLGKRRVGIFRPRWPRSYRP
jgi:urease subunit gamma/beta